jgi:aminoglycoside 6'-N-acetyltransferase
MIELDGQPVGFLCWQVPPRAELTAADLDDLPADLVDIDTLVGAPEHRGHGIGPAALEQLIAQLRTQGVQIVGLGTAIANHSAVRAFEKAGFRAYRDFAEAGEAMRYFVRRITLLPS